MRFRMPAAPPVPPLPAAERGYRPTAPRGADYSSVAGRDFRTAVAPKVQAQVGTGTGKYDARFVIATPRNLQGLFGSTRLRCARENVDLERLDRGLLAWAADHNVERLIGVVKEITFQKGQVRGAADYLDSPFAQSIKAEIDFGARNGCSPGFLLLDYETAEGENYTTDVDVTLWSPFEISSTATPANPESVHLGIQGGNKTMNDLIKPDLLNTSDLAGLSLSVGRRILRDGKGSTKQRERLTAFYAAFDEAVERGLTRSAACEVGRDAAGLER